MLKFIQIIFNLIRESMGHPVTLLRLLDEQPDLRVQLIEPEKNVAASSVVQWHNWGDTLHRKRGTLLGWRYAADGYRSFEIHRPEFEHFGRREVDDDWACDIQTIVGISASKSKLEDFTSLDSMVKKNSPEMIDLITEEKMHKNLAHRGIGILHSKYDSDHFARHLWDGRVFLINSDGSHHFAAARYIAAQIGESVSLKGPLHTHIIDQKAVASLRNDFDMFVTSDDAVIINGFMDAMKAFNATYFWQSLPRPYEHGRVILLPKKVVRSAKVASVLRDAGLFDLGIHLAALVDRQAAA
jgi:hypothetical protein